MKKIVALALALVLVFSVGVPSFAYPHSDTEMEALNEIEYWTYWIHQDFTGYFNDIDTWFSTLVSRSESSLSNLLDINEYLRSVSSEITSLNDNLFGNFVFLEPFAQVIQNNSNTLVSKLTTLESNISQLTEVLADDEDLAFKESQKENQQYVQDTFFSSSSDLSLNLDDFGILTQYVREFKTGYNFEENIGNPLPLTLINTESDFKEWFSDSTGQAMDPTFGGGSGGGGGEDPDPDPDPEPEPIKNWLPLATTEPGGTEIYNGIGYLPGYRWSNSVGAPVAEPGFSITGFIPCTVSDTIFLYNLNINTIVPVGVLFNNSTRVYSIGGNTLPSDSNGVVYFSPSDYVSSCNYFRIVFLGESASDGIISINQYPIQTTSTFSLRARSVSYEPEVVTSYYSDRLLEVERIKGGNK